MVQYNTGTVNTPASSDVHGIGTAWLDGAAVSAGDLFHINTEDAIYTVLSITSNSDLTLTAVYAGTPASDIVYQITRDFTPNYNFPEVHSGDLSWPLILTQALRDIDNEINIASDISISIQSDLVWMQSDIVSAKSDLLTLLLDASSYQTVSDNLVSAKSDLIWIESDVNVLMNDGGWTNLSDALVLVSDVVTSIESDLVWMQSDLTAVKSDFTALHDDLSDVTQLWSDLIAVKSDVVVIESELNVLIAGGGGFVDRGDPSAWDYATADLENLTDNNWHELDLNANGGVPLTAKAVLLGWILGHGNDAAPNAIHMYLRDSGNSNDYNIGWITCTTFEIRTMDVVIPCTGGKIDIKSEPDTLDDIFNDGFFTLVVKGWWL